MESLFHIIFNYFTLPCDCSCRRNPYYRKHRKEFLVNVSNKEDITADDKVQEPLSALGDEKSADNKTLDVPEENGNLTLQLSETEQSDACSEHEDDFILQLSEDEELGKNNQEEQTVNNTLTSQQQSIAKHIISDAFTKEKSNLIRCSEACIVSKELQTSTNEVFEEYHAKQENSVNQPLESKKHSSPVKFFKIFKTYFKENGQVITNSKSDDTYEKLTKESSKVQVAILNEQTKSVEEGKSPKKASRKKKLTKKVTTASEPISRKIHFCTTCRTQVESHIALKQHISMHAEGKTLNVCPICDRVLQTKSGLRRHLLAHSGERRFTCPVCDKKFTRSDYLSAHRKSHKLSK